MIDKARVILSTEARAARALLRHSPFQYADPRMVQLYMSKQMDVDTLLTEAQYLQQWVRDASAIVKLAVRSSPRKAQKTAASGGGFFRGSSLLNGTRPDSPAPDGDADSGGFDLALTPSWRRLIAGALMVLMVIPRA